MKYQSLLAFGALALSAAMPAAAQTVDFNDLATYAYSETTSPLSDGGYTFAATSTLKQTARFLVWGYGQGADTDGTWIFNVDHAIHGASLGIDTGADGMVITKTGGGSFLLNSLDFNNIYNSVYPGDLTLTITFGDSSTQARTVSLDGAIGMQTEVFNLEDVVSVAIQAVSTQANLFQIDNLVTNQRVAGDPPREGAVPEPASWVMMLMGFGALGATLRRRKASVSFA